MPQSPKSKRSDSQRGLQQSRIKSQACRLILPETMTTIFTDCLRFLVMRDEGIIHALTGDHHFEQAGFKALLG
jgi:hypothetical protein